MSSASARFLWITDPWETLDHPRDTTLRLIEESLIQGHESYWCGVQSIRLQEGKILLDARKVTGVFPGRAPQAFKLAEPESLEPREFTRLVYRTDPPVDLAYIHPVQLLILGLDGAKNSEIVNPAETLLTRNEKLEATLLGPLMPPSCVSSLWGALKQFGEKEGKTVAKPLHEAQSKGVALLDWKDEDQCRKILFELSAGFQRPVILQRFLAGISEGEQRLWFLNGKLLAAAKKRPAPGEFKINMDQGGTVMSTELNALERKAALQIGRLLRKRRIRMAAVDLIEGYVTDFNHTSPGLLTQMEALSGANLAQEIVRSLALPWR